jgi:transmembrane E3 ubiquitin-protein ligase
MAFLIMIYELRFLVLIFRVQRPERPITRPAITLPALPRGNGTPQNTPATTAVNTPATTAVNTPATVTVVPATTPIPSPTLEETFEPDTRSEYYIIAKYFYFSVLLLFILSSLVSTHKWMVHLLLLALHSFWVPQVYRNVMRGVRKALGWRYVLGMTISRGFMALALIWYQRGDWVFLWESGPEDDIWGWILLCWLWIQVLALLAQEVFGPRFFISSQVYPPPDRVLMSSSPRHTTISLCELRTRNLKLVKGSVTIARSVCNPSSTLPYQSPQAEATP